MYVCMYMNNVLSPCMFLIMYSVFTCTNSFYILPDWRSGQEPADGPCSLLDVSPCHVQATTARRLHGLRGQDLRRQQGVQNQIPEPDGH